MMREQSIDVLITFKPEHSFYLSGFNPVIYSHPVIAVLPAEGDPAVLVHALRDDHASQAAWIENIVLYGKWATKLTQGPAWQDALASQIGNLHLQNAVIGIEHDFTPISRLRELQALMPGAKFVDSSLLFELARLIKEPAEIEDARRAARIADAGMAAAIEALRARCSEQEISITAMAAMNRFWVTHYPNIEVCDFGSLEGGVHNGLWCWCLTGERVLFNTDSPSARVPVDDELALVLIWTNSNGIHAENERAVAIGKLSAEKEHAYRAVLSIRDRLAPLLRPGTEVREFYSVAKAEYAKHGYAKETPGRIGHGMGLGAHEAPSIDLSSKLVLEPGMLLTFEPNLRFPEWGGLQHSDTVLITDSGCDFLTSSERGYVQA